MATFWLFFCHMSHFIGEFLPCRYSTQEDGCTLLELNIKAMEQTAN